MHSQSIHPNDKCMLCNKLAACSYLSFCFHSCQANFALENIRGSVVSVPLHLIEAILTYCILAVAFHEPGAIGFCTILL